MNTLGIGAGITIFVDLYLVLFVGFDCGGVLLFVWLFDDGVSLLYRHFSSFHLSVVRGLYC